MNEERKYFRKTTNGGFVIFCPACNSTHYFDHRWTLDEKAKTVTPSMNVNDGECHFNITNGKIIYHAGKNSYTGKTIDMVTF